MMAKQESPIPPSRWWVSLAKPLVRDYDDGYVKLGKEVAKAVGRKRPWSHTALVKFVATGSASAELARDLSTFFKLPRPAFLARSAQEAFEMELVAERYDKKPVSDIEAEIFEMRERLAERERELEAKLQRETEQIIRRRAK